MEIDKQEVMNALKMCSPGVDKGASLIEGADTYTFCDGQVLSYNDHVSVSYPLDIGLKGSVKADDFFRLLGKVKGDKVKLSLEDNLLKLEMPRSIAKMAMVSSEIPNRIQKMLESEGEWKDLPENFSDFIKLCFIANNNAPCQGYFIEGNEMLSTNMLVINRAILDVEMETMFLDTESMLKLIKLGEPKKYRTNDVWVSFEMENGATFSLRKLPAATFRAENMRKIIERNITENMVFTHLPEDFAEAVDRASILAEDVSGFLVVHMNIRNKDILLKTEKMHGSFEELLDLPSELGVSGMNENRYASNVFLKEAAKQNLEMGIDPAITESLIFRGPNFQQAVSVMRPTTKPGE